MKLAFVSPRYPQDGAVGGCETLLRNVAEHAASRGHAVHFLTTCATNHFSWDNDVPPGEKDIGPLRVHFFPVNKNRDIERFLFIQDRITRLEPLPLREQREWIQNSVNSDALIDHLRTSDYDRVMAGPYLFGITHAVAEAVPGKTCLVPCLHDESYAYLNIMNLMFRRVRGILFNSQPERELAVKLYGLEPNIGAVVGMGMESTEGDGENFRRKHGIESPYLIYCGRREEGKGTPVLLDYMHVFRERNPDIDLKLVITGAGEIHPHEKLREHLLDLGYVDEQEKIDAMAGALAFMHPSRNESFGIVILESWLAGTPVLVHAKCPVLRELTRAGNGGLWFDHYPHFEGCVKALLRIEHLAAALGASGQRYVQAAYSWQAVGDRLFEALDETRRST